MTESTKVDLGEVAFTFHVTPAGKGMSVGAQLFVHRIAPDPDWEKINAADPPGSGNAEVFALRGGVSDTFDITSNLPVGTYDGYRLVLFAAPDGRDIDYSALAYDTASDTVFQGLAVKFKVESSEIRVSSPRIVFPKSPEVADDGSGTYIVTIPVQVCLPMDFQTPGNGVWAMAKGTCGSSQIWVPLSSADYSGDPDNPYRIAPVKFTIVGVKPGNWSVRFGLFRADWGSPLTWVDSGMDFEIGGDSWETKSTQMPPRLRYIGGRFIVLLGAGRPQTAVMYGKSASALKAVKFIRGGNYGNALDWTIQPALDSPGYFKLLGDHGCRFIRALFNPDRYLAEESYRHAVDQVVQNIWQAGEYPLIAPQDLPKADTLQRRVDLGAEVCSLMAKTYRDKSVWLEICNEPNEFGTWAKWKPVAERYVKTIRGIDHNAFVIVPFEFWSKDGRGAAADPITDVRVDLYDGHAYVAPEEVVARFGTAAKAGLPVLIGEYGSTTASYMAQMDRRFQSMNPGPVAIAPWAFTIKGQDQMPLIESADGGELKFTPPGAAVANAFDAWMVGKRVQ